jgi:peptidoglycan hydrolase CwlO-like protein
METIDILTFIGGIAVSIISYFLKQTMNDLKQVKEIAYETKSKLKVLENDYLNKIDQLNNKFDMLNESIKELTREIKNMK